MGSQTTAAQPPDATEGIDGSAVSAWMTKPEERTPEQRELLDRPEVKEAVKSSGERLARLFADLLPRMLEHPEIFVDEDQPMIRALGRAYRRDGEEAIDELRPVYRRSGNQAVIAAVATAALRPSTQRGHAPRAASNERQQGSRRGDRSTSSSSDDPGGEADDDPPGRTCALPECGESIDHRPSNARFCCDRHATRHRFRAHYRRKAEQDLVREFTELDTSAVPTVEPCECGGLAYTDPEGDRVCSICGHFVDPSRLALRNGWDRWLRGHIDLMTPDIPRNEDDYKRRHIPFRTKKRRRVWRNTRTYTTATAPSWFRAAAERRTP